MDDEAAVRATIGPWTKAALDRDFATLVDMCTPDIVFAPPGEPKVSGAAALVRWLEAFPVMKTFESAFERVDVDGNLATATGVGGFSLVENGNEVTARLKFVDIFRKGRDGRWRYAHVIWNLDAPRA